MNCDAFAFGKGLEVVIGRQSRDQPRGSLGQPQPLLQDFRRVGRSGVGIVHDNDRPARDPPRSQSDCAEDGGDGATSTM